MAAAQITLFALAMVYISSSMMMYISGSCGTDPCACIAPRNFTNIENTQNGLAAVEFFLVSLCSVVVIQ